MATTRLYALLCLALGCTCQPSPSEPGPSPERAGSAAPEGESGPFVFAPLSTRREVVPARFGASLPTTVETWRRWGEEFPPRAHVEDMLGSSDNMRLRFASAVTGALEGGASMEEVLTVHGAMVRWLEPDECGWLGEWAERSETPERARPFFWIEFASCAPAGDEARFAREDLPARAVLARYAARISDDPNLEVSPRLLETLRGVLAQESATGDFVVTSVGVSALLRFEGALEATLRLRREFPAAADAIDPLLRNERDPRAQRLFEEYCRRNAEVRECRMGGPRWRHQDRLLPDATRPTPSPLAVEVRRYDFDALAFVREHPGQRAELREELAECTGDTTYAEYLCLRQLALIDRALARELAESFDAGNFLVMRALLRTLRQDTDATTLGARMLEMHLIEETHPEAVTPRDHLLADGRALQFDTETGIYPNEHDSLLRRLSALAPSAFGEAVFAEETGANADGPYQLHAWREGQRWSTEARNLGDWYDVEAVVGMLNSLARSAESSVRWVVLMTEDQTAMVVAAPQDALENALHEGLIEASGSDEARAAGLEAEERALQER